MGLDILVSEAERKKKFIGTNAGITVSCGPAGGSTWAEILASGFSRCRTKMMISSGQGAQLAGFGSASPAKGPYRQSPFYSLPIQGRKSATPPNAEHCLWPHPDREPNQ